MGARGGRGGRRVLLQLYHRAVQLGQTRRHAVIDMETGPVSPFPPRLSRTHSFFLTHLKCMRVPPPLLKSRIVLQSCSAFVCELENNVLLVRIRKLYCAGWAL